MNSASTPENPLADTHANYTDAVLDGKAAGLIPTTVDIPPVLPDYEGLSPAAQARMKTEPDLNTPMNITQAALDQEIKALAQGDAKARAALRMMAVMAPAYRDIDPTGPRSMFEMVRRAGLSGKEIGTFYEICDNHPVKALGALYAQEHFGLIADASIKEAVSGKADRGWNANQRVDALEKKMFLNQHQAEADKRSGVGAPVDDVFILGKPKADYEAKLASLSEPRVQNQGQDQRSISLLTAEDTPRTALVKLGLGDERAERTLAMIAGMAEIVDRNAITGSMAPLMTLDSLGITGEKVIAFHEACGSPFATVAVLRAHQLGFVSDEQLQKVAAAKPGANVGGADVTDLDVNDLIVQVTEALPKFRLPDALKGSSRNDAVPGNPGTGGGPVPSVPKKLNLDQSHNRGQGKGGVGGQ